MVSYLLFFTSHVRSNPKPTDQLILDARFCSQKLFEFALEIGGKATVNHTLKLFYRNDKLTSSLRGYFGKEIIQHDGIAVLADVKPHIEKYMGEVYERRNERGK